MVIRALLIVLILFTALVFPAPEFGISIAHAQTLRGTVVLAARVSEADENKNSPAVEAVEQLLARRNAGLLSMHEARDRFVVRSRAPMGANDADVDVLAREARAALEHVAFGRTQAAQRSVKEVLARAEKALESLNRQTDTARQVLDACLALVRSALHTNDRRAALDQATSCRRLVPDVAPNLSLHPASVVGVLAEADDQLRRMRTGRLEVSSSPETACSVYLNGRHLGTTPFVLDRAVAGSYRVQVECSEARGRVHLIELGDEPVKLRVDTQLDRAIGSEPRLTLSYANGAQLEKLVVDHAAQVARAVRAESAVVVYAEGENVTIWRVSAEQGQLLGRVRATLVDARKQKAELARALDAVWEGHIEAVPSAPAVATTPPASHAKPAPVAATATEPSASSGQSEAEEIVAPPSNDASRSQGTWKLWTGGALAVAALGTFATGAFFEQRVQKLDDDLASRPDGDPGIPGLVNDYDRATNLRWIGLGGALSVGTVAVLAKARPAVPWWSYVITGAGVALASVGIYDLATTNRCELRAQEGFCIQAKNSEGRGALLLTASAPLLAVLPTHFLLRGASRERATVGVFPDRHGARAVLSLQLRGL